MSEEKSDIHSGIAVAIIFSIAAIIMSICSLARNNERVLGFDYLGVIVGILALLVTFLVGWQIAQTLISREHLRNLDSKIDVKTKHNLHINLYHVFLFQGINAQNRNDNTSALDYYIRSLKSAHECNLDYAKIDDVITKIKSITHNDEIITIQLHPTDYHVYVDIIKKCQHDDAGDIIIKLKEYITDNAQSQVTSWASLDNAKLNTGLSWQ
jgi:hypothetical protein